MTQTTLPIPTQEMATLVAKVARLSKLAVELTSLVIEIQTELPGLLKAEIDAALGDENTDNLWVAGSPLAPDELEAIFPPGVGDTQTWYVVLRGQNPGLYPSYNDCDEQVRGVPKQFRQKKSGRLEALAFYRRHYTEGGVEKWTEVVDTLN
ncbi:hypothetical protein C8J57DRAFT_1503618 [Mycena rebaudengoi]|nr:hypothetical protein C8J57DRAFT_1503618 [Mycena rebaudengoi]